MSVPERLAKLDTIVLERGAHNSFEHGVCATELVSWLADEPFSAHPKCVSPVLGSFLRNWNDALDIDTRQRLKPYLPRAISTAADGRDEERAWLCTDWLARRCAPAWLELAGLGDSAKALRALSELNSASVKAASPVLGTARDKAAAAWAAAWAAARAAASDAAWDAASDAASDAAWAAASDAAWDAARAAASDAARAAASDAARAAASDAAWDAASDAASDAAAWAKLGPTKLALQASAFDLLDRMVKPEPNAPAAVTRPGAGST